MIGRLLEIVYEVDERVLCIDMLIVICASPLFLPSSMGIPCLQVLAESIFVDPLLLILKQP